MPKTGSTSIQQYLSNGLSDPAFRYVRLGEICSNWGLTILFSSHPEREPGLAQHGIGKKQIAGMEARFREQLEKETAAAAAAGAVLVLSAERVWNESEDTLQRIATFFGDRGFAVHIMGYVRPYKSFMEARFQQQVKSKLRISNRKEPIGLMPDPFPSFFGNVSMFDGVFGRENVEFFPYATEALEQGCIVRDFCARTGMASHAAPAVRYNEGIRLPAIRLLYAYRTFGPRIKAGLDSVRQDRVMLKAMESLEGPPLRFHSALVSPFLRPHGADISQLERRLGFPLAAQLDKDDQGLCICKEADLFEFDAASLDWLARQSGSRPIRRQSGLAAAREVAAQVHRLYRQGAINTWQPWQAFRRLWK
ncbi:MAG: hypothetical protein RLY31_935 [Bacteroidota bacterium]|jgi:hypothetical protein